ncbi:hypothetical protein AgCh_038699 [Apium graveolens]
MLYYVHRRGRTRGYKELDEEEIEETKRRRREAEEDYREIYDEFGNLKKKYRVKMQQAKTGQVLPGTGCAGWEVEELENKDEDGSLCTTYNDENTFGSDSERLLKIDVIASLLNGRLVPERISPTMLSRVQSQMGAVETGFEDVHNMKLLII